MSGGGACRCEVARRRWRVEKRLCNYSAFNGYRRTPSRYSTIRCLTCNSRWRTRARYVETLADITREEDSRIIRPD